MVRGLGRRQSPLRKKTLSREEAASRKSAMVRGLLAGAVLGTGQRCIPRRR